MRFLHGLYIVYPNWTHVRSIRFRVYYILTRTNKEWHIQPQNTILCFPNLKNNSHTLTNIIDDSFFFDWCSPQWAKAHFYSFFYKKYNSTLFFQHEMIHAYLFVTHNNRDRDGHGPEFHKHMNRINKEAGTNISVSAPYFLYCTYRQHKSRHIMFQKCHTHNLWYQCSQHLYWNILIG